MGTPAQFINPIIEAFLRGAEQGRQNYQAQQEREQQSAMQEQRLKAEKERQKQELDQRKAEFEATQAMLKMQHMWAADQIVRNQFAQNLRKPQQIVTGVPPAIPPSGRTSELVPMESIDAMGMQVAPRQTVVTPMGDLEYDSSTLAFPEDVRKNIALLEEAKSLGQTKGELPKVIAQGQIQAQLRALQDQAAMERTKVTAGASLEGRKIGANATLGAAQISANARIRAAEIGKAANAGDPGAMTSLASGISTGEIPVEKLAAYGLNDKARQATLAPLLSQGIRPFSQKERDELDGLLKVKDILPKFKKLADMRSGSLNVTNLTDTIPIATEIDATLGTVGRIFGGERGNLSNMDIQRIRGLKASIAALPGQNQKVYQEFENEVNAGINRYLSHFSPLQDSMIRKKYNLPSGNFIQTPEGLKRIAPGK